MLTSIRGLIAATLIAGAAIANPAFADETDPPSDLTLPQNPKTPSKDMPFYNI